MLKQMKDTAAFAAVSLLVCLSLASCSNTSTTVHAAAPAQTAANPTPWDPQFNTRGPRTCNPVTSVPTVAQIPALIQCGFEYKGSTDIALMTDIKVQTGGFRAYSEFLDGYASGIDTSAKVMPIRGSMVQWSCVTARDSPGKNCYRVNKPQAEGECYKTTFGDWKCSMVDTKHNDGESQVAPPTEP